MPPSRGCEAPLWGVFDSRSVNKRSIGLNAIILSRAIVISNPRRIRTVLASFTASRCSAGLHPGPDYSTE